MAKKKAAGTPRPDRKPARPSVTLVRIDPGGTALPAAPIAAVIIAKDGIWIDGRREIAFDLGRGDQVRAAAFTLFARVAKSISKKTMTAEKRARAAGKRSYTMHGLLIPDANAPYEIVQAVHHAFWLSCVNPWLVGAGPGGKGRAAIDLGQRCYRNIIRRPSSGQGKPRHIKPKRTAPGHNKGSSVEPRPGQVGPVRSKILAWATRWTQAGPLPYRRHYARRYVPQVSTDWQGDERRLDPNLDTFNVEVKGPRKDRIEDVIWRHAERLLPCLMKLRVKDAPVDARFVARFAVTPSGRIQKLAVTRASKATAVRADCIKAKLARFVFPPATGNQLARVRLPVRLTTRALPLQRRLGPDLIFDAPIVEMTAQGLRFHLGDPRQDWQTLAATGSKQNLGGLATALARARARKKPAEKKLKLFVSGSIRVPALYRLLRAIRKPPAMPVYLRAPL